MTVRKLYMVQEFFRGEWRDIGNAWPTLREAMESFAWTDRGHGDPIRVVRIFSKQHWDHVLRLA
jgi:hypothetical protein